MADPLKTGIAGLDDVLYGGLPPERMYLVQGEPGAGKTTLSMQFLLEGVNRGERAMYVTLSETRKELEEIAHSHGWSLEGLSVVEVSSELESDELETTLYEPAEVELGERMNNLLAEVDRVRPLRVVLDSCSELRLLAQGALRYRRQILALKRRLLALGSTLLLVDNPPPDTPDVLLESVVHGVIRLEQLPPLYGAERRRMRVLKMRGLRYRGGFHDFIIRRGGVSLFPRLVAAEHYWDYARDLVSSGRKELDALLGGGPLRGTSMMLIGSAGSGKSALASQYALAAAERGERVAIFAFDESVAMFRARGSSMGMDLDRHIASGLLSIRQIDPAELSPGQFAHDVRTAVENAGVQLVVLDSLNGYVNAMPQEDYLALQLHELLAYLGQRGVLTLATLVQHGLLSTESRASVDVSYLADTVVLIRPFEAQGKVRKALSVLKKRSGPHENSIRELLLDRTGVHVGPVLAQFAGILTGAPQYLGREDELAKEKR